MTAEHSLAGTIHRPLHEYSTMSSTTSRSVGEAASAPPVFSYAQAAKGRTSSASTSGAPSNQATSGVSTPARGLASAVNTPSGGSERGDQSVNGNIEGPSRAEQQGDAAHPDPKSESSVSRLASPSLGASKTTLPKEEVDDFILVGGPNDSTRDRSAQEKSSIEKSVEGTEGRKGKKGKRQKKDEKEVVEKEKEEVKPDLVPAPLPTINFWQARKAEAAKSKPTSVAQHASTEPTASNDTNKSTDTKQRSKGSDETTKGAFQNSGVKDASPKSQKKSLEGSGKVKDEQHTKRSARGHRNSEERGSISQLPPPVEDAMSWPTPETALEEEKRKASEKADKEEKDESGSNKPRPKEKWVSVPYVPTVAFNTPLPTRGGRGRGGARGGRTDAGGRSSHGNVGAAGEKSQNSSSATGTPSMESEKRMSRGEAPRAASLPPSSKRQSSDQSGARDQRKPSTTIEKAKGAGSKGEPTSNTDFNETLPVNANFEQQLPRGEHSRNYKSEPGLTQENQSRANAADRRSESNIKGFDQPKESANFGKDNRAEGRSERGRGGFRGSKNNGHFQNGQQHPQHIFTNGHGPSPNGYPGVRSAGPLSPPLQPPPFGTQYAIPSSRVGRGGSRANSIPNNTMYGRFGPNGVPGSQHIPPLQTSNPMYDYPMGHSMSATPYNPYIDHVSVLAMVTMQLEYYFSIDNLCKDVFLRSHMDSQGFVFLTFIASFKRIQALTHDFEVVRVACQESEIIELVVGEDNLPRVRRNEGWEKWVRPMEDRDESARNVGPSRFQPQYKAHQMAPLMMPNNHAISPPPFSPNGTDFRNYGKGAPVAPILNGNGSSYHPETPLSAAVPDFAPGLLPVNDAPDPLEAETTFSDEEVSNLTLVFTAPHRSGDSKPKPFHSASSRTFSNGSIDSRSIAEEVDEARQGRALTNGSRTAETSPEAIRRSRSPFTPLSPTKTAFGNPPPVMWVKGQRHQAPVSEHNSQEPYHIFRARALRHRESSTPGETHADMRLLYEFWSHFLCRNFNLTMYNEFRNYACEDSRSNAMIGMNNLISYYDEILNSKKKPLAEGLARHYVELVKSEENNEQRPAFERLRAAWRNGALDMKNRKKIDNFVDQKLRGDLERAPKQKSELP